MWPLVTPLRVVAAVVALAGSVIGSFSWAAGDTPRAVATVEFARLRVASNLGYAVGVLRRGRRCDAPLDLPMDARFEPVFNSLAKNAFENVARSRGLPRVDTSASPFDTDAPVSADYRLAGTIVAIVWRACTLDGTEVKGSLDLGMKWELYSSRQQRVVLDEAVRTTYAVESFTTMNVSDFTQRGFELAMNNFLDTAAVQELLAANPAAAPAAASSPAASAATP